MERVLLDGSTCAFVGDLLSGKDAPSAINIFNLSHLVESCVLHQNVTILDTGAPDSIPAKRLQDASALFPTNLCVIERHSVQDLLEAHLASIRPDFIELRRTKAFGSSETRGQFSEAVHQLSNDLLYPFNQYRDLEGYRALLTDIYSFYRADRRTEHAKPAKRREKLAQLMLHPRRALAEFVRDRLAFWSTPPNRLQLLQDGRDVFSAYESVHRYGDPSGGSPFAEWASHAHWTFTDFAGGILLRAGFYLIAARVLGLPYKADFLRWPLCWRHFYNGAPGELAVEENIFRMADEYEHNRANVLTPLIRTGAVLLIAPVLLRAVLRQASTPTDVMRVTEQIRNSRGAQRFRQACKSMNEAVTNGDIEIAIREMGAAMKVLNRDTDSGPGDGLYAMLSIPQVQIGTAPFGILPQATISGEGLAKAGKDLVGWWKARKYTFVSKIIGQARQAKSLEHEIRRVFGAALRDQELVLLDRLERMDRTRAAN